MAAGCAYELDLSKTAFCSWMMTETRSLSWPIEGHVCNTITALVGPIRRPVIPHAAHFLLCRKSSLGCIPFMMIALYAIDGGWNEVYLPGLLVWDL